MGLVMQLDWNNDVKQPQLYIACDQEYIIEWRNISWAFLFINIMLRYCIYHLQENTIIIIQEKVIVIA